MSLDSIVLLQITHDKGKPVARQGRKAVILVLSV